MPAGVEAIAPTFGSVTQHLQGTYGRFVAPTLEKATTCDDWIAIGSASLSRLIIVDIRPIIMTSPQIFPSTAKESKPSTTINRGLQLNRTNCPS